MFVIPPVSMLRLFSPDFREILADRGPAMCRNIVQRPRRGNRPLDDFPAFSTWSGIVVPEEDSNLTRKKLN